MSGWQFSSRFDHRQSRRRDVDVAFQALTPLRLKGTNRGQFIGKLQTDDRRESILACVVLARHHE
jgi:hypothetical protein